MSYKCSKAVRTIYDVGSNNGDDLDYYLLKADKVIAVEANPELCKDIEDRFRDPILQGRLVVENCAIVQAGVNNIDFYVHKSSHVLSRLDEPQSDPANWNKLSVKATTLSDLIKKHGEPYYIKLDIEGCEEEALADLLANDIRPSYISAESHRLGVFALLSDKLGYKAFKLVDGFSVPRTYSNSKFYSYPSNRLMPYSFPAHSAGPFGEDLQGDWLDRDSFLRLLSLHKLGWKDIHAKLDANPRQASNFQFFIFTSKFLIGRYVFGSLSRVFSRFTNSAS